LSSAARRPAIDPLELYASAIDTSDYVGRVSPMVRFELGAGLHLARDAAQRLRATGVAVLLHVVVGGLRVTPGTLYAE
jgi:hypothetical protein